MTRASVPSLLAVAVMLLAVEPGALAQAGAPEGETLPSFSKVFDIDTIGPGSVSMLIFTIDNSDGPGPVEELAFTDDLPIGMSLASPAFVSNTCFGTVTAPDGGDEVSLVDGMVGVGTCEIVVLVTATTDCGELVAEGGGVFECVNTTGDLTSTAGNSGEASASLFVDEDLPGFSKDFDASTVEFGGRSTLTFTIDNSASGDIAAAMFFTDALPAGMVVADPSNSATDCLSGVVTAVPGSGVISFLGGLLFAESSCTIDVDVIGAAVGSLGNVSGDLSSGIPTSIPSGKAAAVLEVTGFVDPLALEKEFIDDPTPPGGTVTLEFTLTNQDRDFPATGLAFDDDLGTVLEGLAPSGPLPTDPCGAGSTLTFTPGTPPAAVLSLTGGTLPAEGSCTFGVALDVPGSAVPGPYVNTTTAVTGTIDGMPETGNTASDLLFVVSFPVLTKEFTDDPVAAGDPVTLEFTITNPEPTSGMTGIEFLDELTGGSGGDGTTGGFLPFPVSVTLPPVPDPPCGLGSSLALVSIDDEQQGLSLTDGVLTAAGTSEDSCTFSVTLDIPLGFESGTYTNTTEDISAVLPDLPGAPTAIGPGASDDIVILAAPDLTKEFVDDPAFPGGTVTLEFNLGFTESAPGDATDIGFSDDLTTLVPPVPGLMATAVGPNTCTGSTVDISTPTLIDFSTGTLSPGEECAFTVTLSVPLAASSGFHANSTSEISATVSATSVANNPAEDDLLITGLLFSKEFTDDPAIPGAEVTLEFTLDNTTGTSDATAIFFFDDLRDVLPGTPDLGVVPPLPVAPCGGTLTEGPTGFLGFTGGSVDAGVECSFAVGLSVPSVVEDGDYNNVTSGMTATIDGGSVTLPAATDVLTLNSNLLELTKEFTDDPAQPDGTVTLEFTITNGAAETVTSIAFTDDLDAALSGLEATAAPTNTCGGMGTGFPTGFFDYSDGSLLPGATCSIVLTLDVPAGPLPGSVFPNTTSEVTGFAAVPPPLSRQSGLAVFGDPASDDLVVELLTLSKAFDGATVAGGSAVLTFTLDNLDSVNAASPLTFSDDLDAVIPGLTASALPVGPCGGTVAGTSFLTFTGGSLAAGESCSFEVTVDVPLSATGGSFLNATSGLTISGLQVAAPATAFLTIEPAPTFDKEFIPDSILQGGVSTLVFTIDNTASSLAASSLDFTDVLPAGVVVATPPDASTTCTGGTITAGAGSGSISYTRGSVAASASCTVEADVTASVAGTHVNTTGDLTSSSGVSGTATDELTVIDSVPPQVTSVGSILDTGDGELEACETARTTVTALTATFSEAMFVADPSDPNSVTNPDNWFVVGSGPDQDLSTTVCGPTIDDDVATPIDEVTYDGGLLTATVTFDEALADAPYRLIACSGGLTDLVSNALDGDGNGTGGDDFAHYFRVDRIDTFVHGNFDCTIDDWVASSPADIFFHRTEDVDDADISGSAGFTNPIGNMDLSIGQCVELIPESIYELSGFVRLNTAGIVLDLISSCEFYASSDCSGPATPTEAFFATITTPLVWESFSNELVVLETVNSGICQLTLRNVAAMPYSANADDLSMDAIFTMILFRDGFESGDTSAWSTTVP